MPEFFIKGSAGYCGTDFAEVVEANDIDEAYEIGEDITRNWRDSYSVDDEEDGYEPELDYYVEPYDPEKHDMYL